MHVSGTQTALQGDQHVVLEGDVPFKCSGLQQVSGAR
jgi:hypothetical protein